VPQVAIHYLRPPDRLTVYRQALVHEHESVRVTLARNVELERPLEANGRIILEPGADAVWFTFPGAWHDIGRFHLRDGTFTGLYANVITPCVIGPGHEWHTTDLFLDIWLPAGDAPPVLLDGDELSRAEGRGHLTPERAARARREAASILHSIEGGTWPPPIVHEWTLARAGQSYDEGGSSTSSPGSAASR
jgi:uncharacterized protein